MRRMMGRMATMTEATIPELTLGWRLQMALRQGDMTVQDMADALDMSRTSLSRWLNDKGAPPRSLFVREWARLTGVDEEWLIYGNAAETVRHQGLEPRTLWLTAGGESVQVSGEHELSVREALAHYKPTGVPVSELQRMTTRNGGRGRG